MMIGRMQRRVSDQVMTTTLNKAIIKRVFKSLARVRSRGRGVGGAEGDDPCQEHSQNTWRARSNDRHITPYSVLLDETLQRSPFMMIGLGWFAKARNSICYPSYAAGNKGKRSLEGGMKN